MGLQSAMTTALTGLQAAETTIDVIGNNVANSNTVGFKASEVVFATQFLQTLSIGSAPSDTSGGTNPRQIGLGVRVSSISPDFSQGTIEISANALDMAIQGDGFLMVQGAQGEELYTRNGQLTLNSENQIVTSNGNALLGYGVNDDFELQTASLVPLEIPLGSERVAQQTTEAVFQGVLNPSVDAGTVPGVVMSETLGDSSVGFPTSADPDADVIFDSADVAISQAPIAGSAVAVNNGGTALDAGTYTYRITLLDSNGLESTGSSEFSATTTGAEDTVDLSSLPNVTDPWNGGVRIYRTDETGTGTFYEVGELTAADVAGSVTTFSDTMDNTTLVSQPTLDTEALDNGTYSYYVTFVNTATGEETRPSSVLGSYGVGDNSSSIRLDFSDLAEPVDEQYTQMRIYRNAAGDTSTFYEVATLDAPGEAGFLSSYIDNTPSDSITSNSTLDFDGVRALSGTLLTDIQVRNGSTFSQPFQAGTLSFTGELGGSSLSTQELEITAATTLQDLMDFMNQSLGLQEQSNVADVDLPLGGGNITVSDGQLVVTSNYGEENSVSIPLTAFRLTPTGSEVPETIDLTFSETQEANGPGTTTEFLVYDSLGTPVTVRMTTVLETADSSSTTYRWYATSGDSNPGSGDLSTEVGNGLMVFDSSGNLLTSPSASISIDRNLTAGESPLEVDLDLSSVTSLVETNAQGDLVSSFNMVRQDGFPPGVLTDFIITDDGLIQGQFSNGTQRQLGQVLMARFSNDKGLQQIGNSLFAQSVNSGEPFVSTPGEDGIGTLTAGAVELSNSDIGQDLVEMILAQTQYQAGSRVISTAQELLDELLALQR